MSTDWKKEILLSADALRAGRLSCYGYPRETSPVLDEPAEGSIRFTNAYSASSHTREAVPALLTSEYPDVAVDNGYRLASETAASTLSEEGFATGGLHLNPFVSRAYGFDERFDHFDDDLHLGQHKLIALAQRTLDKLRNRHYTRAEEINDWSLSWVDLLAEDEPFFLWNHYMDTHGPYGPPGEYATLYADDGLSGRDAQSLYQRAIDDSDSVTDGEQQLLINLYNAKIRYNDEQIGMFLDVLREHGVLGESLLTVTADHGDAFGEHGYYEHPRYLHDEITHVSLFVRPPGGASRVVEEPVSTLDIVATIESGIGESALFSLLEDVDENRCVFSQVRDWDEHSHLRRYAVRTQDGVCFDEYGLDSGPTGFEDMTDRSLRSELETRAEQRVRLENGDGAAEEEVNEEIERRLNALGYTD